MNFDRKKKNLQGQEKLEIWGYLSASSVPWSSKTIKNASMSHAVALFFHYHKHTRTYTVHLNTHPSAKTYVNLLKIVPH